MFRKTINSSIATGLFQLYKKEINAVMKVGEYPLRHARLQPMFLAAQKQVTLSDLEHTITNFLMTQQSRSPTVQQVVAYLTQGVLARAKKQLNHPEVVALRKFSEKHLPVTGTIQSGNHGGQE